MFPYEYRVRLIGQLWLPPPPQTSLYFEHLIKSYHVVLYNINHNGFRSLLTQNISFQRVPFNTFFFFLWSRRFCLQLAVNISFKLLKYAIAIQKLLSNIQIIGMEPHYIFFGGIGSKTVQARASTINPRNAINILSAYTENWIKKWTFIERTVTLYISYKYLTVLPFWGTAFVTKSRVSK